MPGLNQAALPVTVYEITVSGSLDESWSDWFLGMTILTGETNLANRIAILKGPVADQSALRGLLCKLWDMNLTLISIRRLESDITQEERND
jgi:hypothetical protein